MPYNSGIDGAKSICECCGGGPPFKSSKPANSGVNWRELVVRHSACEGRWVSGRRSLTESTAWFLAGWAKRLSWNEVARVFRTPWDQVFSSVEMAVSWGHEHQNLEGIEAID